MSQAHENKRHQKPSPRTTASPARKTGKKSVPPQTAGHSATGSRNSSDACPELIRGIIENIGMQIAYLDSQFNFLHVNTAYALASGHTRDELIGANYFALFPNGEDQAVFERVRATNEPVHFQGRPFVFPNQTERGIGYWDWTLAPIKDNDGRARGFVLSLLDVTESTRAETEIRRLTSDLKQHIEELATFNEELEVANEELRLTNEALTNEVRERQRAEDALRVSEARFRFILDNSPVVVAHLDRELRYTWVYNPAAGFTSSELLGETVGLTSHPQDRQHMFTLLRKVLADGIPVKWEIEAETEKGPRLYETHAEPLRDSQGEITGIAILAMDITERYQADAAVRAHRELLETVVKCIPAAVNLIRGSDLRLQLVNPAYQEIAPGKDMIGKTLDELWPETGKNFGELCRQVLASGEPYHAEDQLNMIRRGPDSPPEPAYFSWSLHRVRLPGDEGWGILNTAWETTERKRAEEGLRISNEKFTTAFAGNPAAMVITRLADGRFLDVNDAWMAMLGYRREEAIGRTSLELGIWPAVEARANWMAELQAKRSYRNHEITLFRKSGEPFVTLGSAEVLQIDGEQVVLTSLLDITDRKRAEAEREELLARERTARAEAEAAVQVRDQFISLASHELKTPLTAMKGYAEILQQRMDLHPELADLDRRAVLNIHKQTRRLERMINELLNISRLRTGHLTLQRATVDLTSLLKQITEGTRIGLRQHHLRLTAPSDPILIEGDDDLLTEMFENLIQNAIKYSPSGGLIDMTLRREGERATLRVKDQGIGIPQAELPHIFERFYRATNAESYHINGLGIGLYVAREIARLHGGDLTVESQEGSGSTFTATLPIS